MPWLPLSKASDALGIDKRTLRKMAEQGRHEWMWDPNRARRRLYMVNENVETVIHPDDAGKPVTSSIKFADPVELEADVPAPVVFSPVPTGPSDKVVDPQRIYTVASLWDVHVPDHDEKALRAVFAWLEDNQPDCLVIGGDFMELASMSQHGGDPNPPSMNSELDAGRRILYRLRAILPDSKIVYLEGNHETRHERKVINRLPELFGVNTIPELLHLPQLGIHWLKYQEMWQPRLPSGNFGKLYYTHGKWALKHHANKHLDQYGVSTRYGHTHKPQTFTRGYADGAVRIGIGSPCLRTLDPDWAGKAAGWCHGFGVDLFMPDGTFTNHNVIMVNRRFAYAGKIYGA